MPRPAYEAPSELALAVSRAFRREIGDRRLSGRAFAELLGRSEKYVRDRLNDVYAFSIDDIETFCRLTDVAPQDFFASLERGHVGAGFSDRTGTAGGGVDGSTKTATRRTTKTAPAVPDARDDLMDHLG